MYAPFDDHWFAKHCRISNVRTMRLLELLETLLYPAVLEIFMFGIKPPNIIGIKKQACGQK